jgi:hypothetical protein
LIYFDEGTDFVFAQYRFIIGWNRSALPNQRCRVVMGSNPPTTAEGLWVIKHWAPWLDPLHPRPARPGELRWFTTGPDGEDIEVDGRGPHLVGGEDVWARSRSYLPARLSDNPRPRGDGLWGGLGGLKDHEFQVIPTAWIEAAQNRWRENGGLRQPMTAIGVDVAQGGPARSVVAPRHGGWYAPLVRKGGEETRDGAEVAKMVNGCRSNNCPVIVDVGGGCTGWTSGAVAPGAFLGPISAARRRHRTRRACPA